MSEASFSSPPFTFILKKQDGEGRRETGENGATTLVITTLHLMTLSIMEAVTLT